MWPNKINKCLAAPMAYLRHKIQKYRLTAFFVQDVSLDITDTIKVTLRQLYNPERKKRNINIIVLPFSRVEKSNSCCYLRRRRRKQV